MNIEALVWRETWRHLEEYSHIRNMDPMAQHILKTSQKPLLSEMRAWMRREALRQCLEAHRGQKVINKQFAQEPVLRGTNFRRCAVLHPYFAADMPRRDKTSWNDPDYVGSVKRDNPEIFPKRDTI